MRAAHDELRASNKAVGCGGFEGPPLRAPEGGSAATTVGRFKCPRPKLNARRRATYSAHGHEVSTDGRRGCNSTSWYIYGRIDCVHTGKAFRYVDTAPERD